MTLATKNGRDELDDELEDFLSEDYLDDTGRKSGDGEDNLHLHPSTSKGGRDGFQNLDSCNPTSSDIYCPSAEVQGHQNGEDQVGEWVEEVVEEQLLGRVVLGNDSRFYVELQTECSDLDKIDLDKFDMQVLQNVDGTQMLMFEDTIERDKLIARKARAKIDEVVRRRLDKLHEDPGQLPRNEEVIQEELPGVDWQTQAEYDQYGNRQKKTRVFGACRCMECGQSFINMARMERHLAVHQQFGSYLCPLCGKVYKYEYNLFYHWRRTCKDMSELLSQEERKLIEINALRQLVEEIAQKKASIGPLDLTVTQHYNLRTKQFGGEHPTAHPKVTELTPKNLFAGQVVICRLCHLSIYKRHFPHHLATHRSEKMIDERGIGGAFFCELCGLMFRSHENLIKHWRSNCPEIQANVPVDYDIAMNDITLKHLVIEIMKKACGSKNESTNLARLDDNIIVNSPEPGPSNLHIQNRGRKELPNRHKSQEFMFEQQDPRQELVEEAAEVPEELDENFALTEGLIFADDLLDTEDDTLLISDDGRLINPLEQQPNNMGNEQPNSFAAQASVHTVKGPDGKMSWIQYQKSVQCSECFRSFSSIQRLEKHVAGTHGSFGTHHCLFCGSRFKYEYNLLFHYRKICPYTLELLGKAEREQMDAPDLKRVIRQFASRKDFLPNPALLQTQSIEDATTGNRDSPGNVPFKPAQLGDSIIRRRMMENIIQKHAPKDGQQSSNLSLPPVLLQPSYRPDLPEGNQCPICSIVFYGLKVLARHLKAAHPNESAIWEESLRALASSAGKDSNSKPKLRAIHMASAKGNTHKRKRKLDEDDNEERPPQLMAEECAAEEMVDAERYTDREGNCAELHLEQQHQSHQY